MNPLFQYGDLAGDPTGMLAGVMAMMAGLIIVMLVVLVAVYVYFALALMAVAKRTKTGPAWLAWIPIGNLYLVSKIAKMHWWPLLLLLGALIPFLGIVAIVAFTVFAVIWEWKVCEARSKPGWWALLTLIPFVGGIWNLVMWGILAWGKN